MGLTRMAGLPVVGDIDRGGVLASMFGTLAMLSPEDQRLIAGFVVTGFAATTVGLVPWRSDLWLDAEDSLDLDRRPHTVLPPLGWDTLSIALVRLHRLSNVTAGGGGTGAAASGRAGTRCWARSRRSTPNCWPGGNCSSPWPPAGCRAPRRRRRWRCWRTRRSRSWKVAAVNGEQKISGLHRDRLAVIYLRQSSMAQVREHTESTARQYGLVEEAVRLGWARADVVMIDTDLGGDWCIKRSGVQSADIQASEPT
jgi:hypothetical protein